jgi:hypothetical protein
MAVHEERCGSAFELAVGAIPVLPRVPTLTAAGPPQLKSALRATTTANTSVGTPSLNR